MFQITGKLEGMEALLKRMAQLKSGSGRGRMVRKALNAAGKPVLTTAKEKCPKDTGLLRKSLGRKTVVRLDKGKFYTVIGPRTGFKRETKKGLRNPTRYAHLVERGTRRFAARPFMRPAWDENRQLVQEIMRRELAAGIAEAARK